MSLKIAGRHVGYDYDPLIIAEIGINHGGSLDIAKHMVNTAEDIGIEIIPKKTMGVFQNGHTCL